MKTITPHLWFDKEAKEAAEFYTKIFNGKILSSNTLHDTPSGDVDSLTIELLGQEFAMISAGPLFKFNPSISFMVAVESAEEVDRLWAELSEGGKPLMELNEYPFSPRYGWLMDRYGLSWQLGVFDLKGRTQQITPTLMFVGEVCGKAEEAMNFYTSIFENSAVNYALHYGEMEDNSETDGTLQHGDFSLNGQHFAAMDSPYSHDFNFNEAVSLMVHCDNQKEIDYFWEKLSAVPEAEQCGWLKDKYGVSWQIVPAAMDKMMSEGSPEQLDRVTQTFLQMKKFNIEELERAYKGE